MSKLGKVYLVGAGPGDPELLTLRGRECLQTADLVLYDGLVNPLILDHTTALAERTSRSATPRGSRLDQEQINRQLIDAARSGKTVVRLKGGDPFIFGRGGEEAAALSAAGIPFEVVPGITAAVAVAEYAGISLTHRESASAVAFVTGHEDPAKGESVLDFRNLAQFSGTLVFYMGLHRIKRIVAELIEAGKPGETPAAVISCGTTPFQRTVAARLDDLPDQVRNADLHAPSLIIVGECVRHRETIAWFEKRPLFGKRVGITRPAHQAGAVVAKSLQLGAQPILLPTIQILPPASWERVDEALTHLAEYDWLVFTSANGVRSFLGRLWEQKRDVRALGGVRIAAIGPATAQTLAEFHLRADVVPATFRAEELADELAPMVAAKRVLWLRASRGRDVLPQRLKQSGATVDELIVYQNIDVEFLPDAQCKMIERGEIDWIGLSSPSIARSLARLLTPTARSQLGGGVRLATISKVTTEAAELVGLPVAAEATSFTWDGIFQAIVDAETAERASPHHTLSTGTKD